MKKTLLSLAAIVLSLGVAHAQLNVLTAPAGALQKAQQVSTSTPNKAPKKIELADNQLIMGGYTSDTYATSNYGLGLTGYPGTLRVASELPASDFLAFDGGKVVKMRVALANSAAVTRVFIAPVTSSGSIGADIVSQSVSFNSVGWNEVELTSPVTLDFSGYSELLMGFDYTQTSGSVASSYPLSMVDEGATIYNVLVYGNLGQGTGWYSLGNSYGNLSVQAIIEKDFEGDAADLQKTGSFFVPFGKSTEQYFPLRNMGKNALASVSYTLTIDGQVGEEQTASLDGVAFGEVDYLPITFNSAETEKTQTYELTITKVNGSENASENNSVSGLFATSSRQIDKRVAIEENTGTGCGWCPRGIVGMEMLRRTYGDRFVGIAVHQFNSGDAMFIDYDNYAETGMTSAPLCAVNRQGFADPYYGSSEDAFGISNIFDAVASQPALLGVEVSGEWNADSTQVVATAVVDGIVNGDQYNLEFVLVGDSLKGTGSAWNQGNNYAQYTAAQAGQDLADFCRGGKYGQSSVSGLYFNDVALASSYAEGINQAEPVTVASGEAVEAQFTLTLPTKATLANAIDTHNLYVAVLVVDPVNGNILNSAKTQLPFFNPTTTGITTLQDSEAQMEERYTIDGRRIATPQKGLNVVRTADGHARKVFVR